MSKIRILAYLAGFVWGWALFRGLVDIPDGVLVAVMLFTIKDIADFYTIKRWKKSVGHPVLEHLPFPLWILIYRFYFNWALPDPVVYLAVVDLVLDGTQDLWGRLRR